MKLSFGNMMIELNVFNICRQPRDNDNELHKVDLIETILEDVFHESSSANLSKTWNTCVDIFMNSDDEPSIETIHALLEPPPGVEKKWGTRFEELPSQDSKPLPSYAQPPKLEFKPLPPNLKYAFFSEEGKLPMVISSHLDKDKQMKLLNMLKEHRSAIGWTITNIKGISPLVCTDKIYLEDNQTI